MSQIVVDLPIRNTEDRSQDMEPPLGVACSSTSATIVTDAVQHDQDYRLHRDYILPAESCRRHGNYRGKLNALKEILSPSSTSLPSVSKHRRSSTDFGSWSSSSRSVSECTTPTEAEFDFKGSSKAGSGSVFKDRIARAGGRIRGLAQSQFEKLRTDPEEKAARKIARIEAKEKQRREWAEAVARMSIEGRDEFGIPYGHYDWRLGLAHCW